MQTKTISTSSSKRPTDVIGMGASLWFGAFALVEGASFPCNGLQQSRSMKMKASRLAAAFFISCQAWSVPCRGADPSKENTWQQLFNGKDFSGWVAVHDVTFVVTNGNLRLVKGMGWLRTEKEFEDFILEVEWRGLVPEYDSGFFVRAGLEGKPWPKDVWQVNLQRAALGGLVKGYKTIVPAETPPMPLNQWVKFRIEVRGKRITLDVNGERAWEYSELDATRGYLGIQVEEKAFDFRNIRLQELSVSPK